jgi:restriction system protein
MAESETTVWCIRGGKTGDVGARFVKEGVVALGWPAAGDFAKLGRDRDSFKTALAHAYQGAKPGALVVWAGQLYRFVHDVHVGDLVAYPSKLDRQVHLGRIESTYRYEPSFSHDYPNVRSVKWLRSVPRTHFTQGALYEIGAILTLFQIKTYADEFRIAAEGKTKEQAVATADVTVGPVADEIEETTRDFILKRLAQELKGHPLSEFVAHLLQTMGYRTRVSPEGPDGGIDIIAHKDVLGFEPPIIKVQVKSTEGSIGDPVVASLYGKVGSSDYGLFVTLGVFTPQARTFERGKSNLRLIDGDELIDLVLQQYERLDPKYKGLIPLKQVYVPETIEGADS